MGILSGRMRAGTTALQQINPVRPVYTLPVDVAASVDFGIRFLNALPTAGFALDEVPSGMTLDEDTGILSGTPDTEEEVEAMLTVSGAKGAELVFAVTFTVTA